MNGKNWKKKQRCPKFLEWKWPKNHWHLLRNDMSFLWVMQGKDLFMAFFHSHVPLVPSTPPSQFQLAKRCRAESFRGSKISSLLHVWVWRISSARWKIHRKPLMPSWRVAWFEVQWFFGGGYWFGGRIAHVHPHSRSLSIFWGSSSCIQYNTYIYIQTCYTVQG